MIKGAILDMDGTLLDSMGMWWELGVKLLKDYELYSKDNVEMIRRMTLEQVCSFVGNKNRRGKSGDEILSEINSYIFDMYANKLHLKAGALELLLWLRKNGVKMCIATSTAEPLARAALGRIGVLGCFDAVFSSCELGCGKTTPALYDMALAHLKTPKEKTVVFEDVVFALKLVKDNDYRCCGVFDKNEADQDSMKKLSDIYISDLADTGSYTDKLLAI
jgi:thiamine-phosphate pyrophosphorylase